jgi:hypothetical protein
MPLLGMIEFTSFLTQVIHPHVGIIHFPVVFFLELSFQLQFKSYVHYIASYRWKIDIEIYPLFFILK